MNMELAAMHWLRFKRQCPVVLMERTPLLWGTMRPDVLGVTHARYCIEVEVKRTLSDFKANARKRHVQNREHYLPEWPKEFWFIVTQDLASKVASIVPDWAGLLTVGDGHCWPVISKAAPINRDSKRLSIRATCRLAHLMSSQIVSQATVLWQVVSSRRWVDCEHGASI